VAAVPGQRILNSADPDAPNGLQIAGTIAAYLQHEWKVVLLDDENSDLGRHPWDVQPSIVLDTRASLNLGYIPAGTYAQTVTAEIDWLVDSYRAGHAPTMNDPFFAPLLDYAAEDVYLSHRIKSA
jgi:hypothetical protein